MNKIDYVDKLIKSGKCLSHPTEDAVPGKRKCSKCAGRKVAYDSNRLDKAKEAGLCYRCMKQTRRLGFANCEECSNRAKRQAIQQRYGLSAEDIAKLLIVQKHVCAVCKKNRKLHVDHSHKTGEVRGLLCGPCNRALGMLCEDPNIIRALADYVKP